MITKFAEALKEERLFATILPLSSGEWDYSTAIEEWGTKWDASYGDVTIDEDGKSCYGWFDTAWGPAIEFYEKIYDLGFEIDVVYHEPGMCFAGHFSSPFDDYCVEYNFEEENWRDEISDPEVLELLEQEYENWAQWNQEIE
jgi:hypothetical protein